MTSIFMQPQTFGVDEVDRIGQQIAASLHDTDVLLLSGELGSGKTTLAKAIARALGVQETVTSPTFTLMNVYKTNHSAIETLMHMDTYRMERTEELAEIGASSYLGAKGTVCIVEWPERFPDAWGSSEHTYWLTLSGTGETRTIQARATA